MLFVSLLRELRLKAELSQESLARALDADQTYVSDVELGKRRQDIVQIHAWASACGHVSLSELIAKYERSLKELQEDAEVRSQDLRLKDAPRRLRPVRKPRE